MYPSFPSCRRSSSCSSRRFSSKKSCRWVEAALLVIFIGGCLVVRPWNFSSFNVYSLFALGQAVFAAGAYTTVSKLTGSGRHHPYEVVLYFLVCAALSGIVLMALTDGFVMPAHGDWIYYGGLALFSVIARFG